MLRRSLLPHCRRSIVLVTRHERLVSTSLRPLAPRALLRFLATMDALTPVGWLFGPLRGHERQSVAPTGLPASLVHTSNRSVPNHPPPLSRHFSVRPPFSSARESCSFDPVPFRSQRVSFPPWFGAGLRSWLAGSPVGQAESGSLCVMFLMPRCYGPVVHLRQLPTPCCHNAVAFGYRRVNVPPDRDFHPAV